MDSLRLLLVFILILIALRKKVPVGVTLFGAGVLTAVLYWVPLGDLTSGYWDLIRSRRFISLTGVICFITILGVLLRESGFLQKLTEACSGLWGGRKTATVLLPPLVGMMPMPGGSLLSAPLVDRVLDDPRYQPHFKCATNYYFRHVIEHFWPIYPGIVVTEAITGLPAATVALLQSPLAAIMLILGFIFFIRHVKLRNIERRGFLRSLIGILAAIWPIGVAVVIYGVFKIELALAILLAILTLLLAARPPWGAIKTALQKGLSYKLIFLVFGILSFQTALELSGAVALLQEATIRYGLPSELVIIVVSFTAGLLTGMFAAYVALAYSLLAGFLYLPEIVPANIFLAFLSGYVGMMFSPAHVCLVVTNDYFKSDLIKVLRTLAPPLLLLAVAGYLIYLSPWPGWVYP
jgi:integral membrane protein (TIGR00529 family)